MNKKPNRTCLVCGKKYYFCNSCGSKDPSYKMIFCSDECRNLFHDCTEFNDGKISVDEFLNRLKKYNLENVDSYDASVRKIIDTAMNKKNKVLKIEAEVD